MHGSERTRVSNGIGNRGSSGEYKRTAVETPVVVVMAAVDVAAAQDAGKSGSNAAEATTVLTFIRSSNQDDTDGTSSIVLPCPGS